MWAYKGGRRVGAFRKPTVPLGHGQWRSSRDKQGEKKARGLTTCFLCCSVLRGKTWAPQHWHAASGALAAALCACMKTGSGRFLVCKTWNNLKHRLQSAQFNWKASNMKKRTNKKIIEQIFLIWWIPIHFQSSIKNVGSLKQPQIVVWNWSTAIKVECLKSIFPLISLQFFFFFF